MRKHIPNLALEAAAAAMAAVPTLSLEEELIEVQETTAEAAEIATDLAEADRIIEVSDALEDLAVIADGIEEATPTEVQLIETAGSMAVAGTDVAPEEIIPALESYQGKKIATESIRDTARKIWENIQKFIKSIWEKIEAFIYRTFGAIPRMRKTIAQLEDKLDDTVGKKPEGKLKLYSGLTALTAGGKVAASESDLKKGLDGLVSNSKVVFGEWADHLVKRGEVIASAIEAFDPAKAGESAANLRAKLEGVSAPKLPKHGGADKNRFPDFEAYYGTPMLGNVSLVIKTFTGNKEASDLAALDRQRHSGLDLVPTSGDTKATATKEVEIDALAPSAMKDLLKTAGDLLDTMEEYNRGSKAKAIAATRKKIEAASDKAASAQGKAEANQDAGTRASAAYYKAMLNFNAAYARWGNTPMVPMISNNMQSLRAILVVVQKSLAAYR